MFNSLMNHQTIFPNGCTILHSNQQCIKVPISPGPGQYLLYSVSVDHGQPRCGKWYLTVVLICLSLMTDDLLMCLLVTCIAFGEDVYSDPLAIFTLGYLFFCCWILKVLSMFWRLVPYQTRYSQIPSPILWGVILHSW